MPPGSLLAGAFSAISVGGKETLLRPPAFICADQTHEPFRLYTEPLQFRDRDEQFLSGVVRTTGMEFDSDRTDIHDVFSLIWAAALRAFGLSSAWLIDEDFEFVPGEMGARHLVLRQCPWTISDQNFETARKSMNAWSAFIFHLLEDVFKWSHAEKLKRPDSATMHPAIQPKWADQIIKYLRYPKDVTVIRRTFPIWQYFASQRRGVTIIRMPKIRVSDLKTILMPFRPQTSRGEEALAFFANGIPNAVPYKLISKASKLLTLTDDACADVMVLPLDSHCLFIGDKTIVALRGDFGREVFQSERDSLIKRRRSEDDVFFANSVVEWKEPLDPGDFEDLCLDLVRREPGVVRAKSVGTVNDRDGGRDILIDLRVPDSHGTEVDKTPSSDEKTITSGGTRTIRVIAQVKARSKTIGKRDVQDIRDTLERYKANGFWLIAHPRISSALVDYLEDLRETTQLNTEWWEARDIEDRLRRHPDIAQRFPKLLNLRAIAYI